ncbi:unnamed protein product [Closterium sp. NIES-54]
MWGPVFPAVILGGAVFYVVKRLARPRKSLSLEWETGRRKARQPHKKPPSFYAAQGVSSSEEYFINSRGVELFTKEWLPSDGRLRGVVLFCHGYGETCTYIFEDVAVMLAAAGYALVGVDYEGHGLSAGRHGYIRSFTRLADDVIEFANRLRASPRFAHLPFFLYGESMGGAMALQVSRRDPTPWNGAVLVAPMCKMAQELIPPAPVIFVLRCLSYIFPAWKLVPVSANPDVCFQVPEKRERAENHPFAYQDKPRLATALQLLRTTQDIGAHMEEVGGWVGGGKTVCTRGAGTLLCHAVDSTSPCSSPTCLPTPCPSPPSLLQVTVPLLILHGAKDVVTDPAASQELFIRSSSADKEIKVYEGCWHAAVTVPLLILHGAKDVVTDPAASQELFIRSSSADKEIKMYEGCWHALTCGEPDDVIARVVGDIIAWLNARSLPPGSVPSSAVPPRVVEAVGGGEVGDAAAGDEMSSTVAS